MENKSFVSRKKAILICVVACILTAIATFTMIVVIPNANGERYVTQDKYELLKKYKELDYVISAIDEYYYEGAEAKDLLEGALKGAASSVGDSYTQYYNEEEYAEYLESTKGEYSGIGITIIKNDEGKIEITSVVADSPAMKAGLKAGDILKIVNGQSVEEKSVQEIGSIVGNSENNKVSVCYERNNEEFTVNIDIEVIVEDMIEEELKDDNIGYIKITRFQGNVVEEFKAAIESLKNKGAKGFIFDVRDNPGGSLKSVTDMLDSLLPAGTIVYTIDVNGHREDWNSAASEEKAEMIVLTNGNSASASEIFAGALKDYKKATIVGEKTFGKGIVQTIFSIPDAATGIKITTSTYYTPNGNMIHGEGISPDHEVKNIDEDDLQLKKALELMKLKLK